MKLKITSCLIIGSLAGYCNAADLSLTPHVSWINYDHSSTGDNTGQLLSLGLQAEVEDSYGSFHRMNIERSVFDDGRYSGTLYPGSTGGRNASDERVRYEYNFGRYTYPAGESDDLGFWTGIGYLSHESDVSGAGSFKSSQKRIYIPAGIEYGTPATPAEWVGGSFRHQNFIFFGAQLNLLMSGTYTQKISGAPAAHLDQDSGHGYSIWFGWDMLLSDGNTLQTKLSYEGWDIGSSEQKSVQGTGGAYQLKQSSSSESAWTLSVGYRL